MYIIHVSPIAKGIGKGQLTYFTSKKIAPGSIVVVPLRNKKVDAIVLKSEDARSFKASIKSSSFKTKKVDHIKSGILLLPEFVKAAEETAKYFAGSTGSVLNILAKHALDETVSSGVSSKKIATPKQKNGNIEQEISLIQAEDDERISTYKGIIREEFAKGLSVFLCLPEISEIERTLKILEKGIEKYTFIFHSKIPKKQLTEKWKQVLNTEHPVLVIGTGSYLCIPRNDFKTIILDKESSGSYKMKVRPFIDIQIFAKFLAKRYGSKLILGDIVLRLETIFQKKHGNYSEYFPLKFRYLSTATGEIADMKSSKNVQIAKKDPYISDEFREIINKAKDNNENIFILVSRLGLHTFVICNDCGETVLCDECGASVILHGAEYSGKTDKKRNLFVCHKCGTEKKAEDKCKFCGSWRLASLGAGIEKVKELLETELVNFKIFRIDSEKTKTHKKILEIRDEFYSTPGSIMVGTEMAIPYLDKNISNIIVFSVDSLFAIPDFKIEERVFYTLLRLRSRASKNFLIQTRSAENKIFDFAIKGNLIDFYREEIALRESMNYPPFSVLIKITIEDKKIVALKEMDKLAKLLEDYGPVVFPSYASTVKNKYRVNILLKISAKKWIDEKLIEILSTLPMSFVVNVEPENIL